MFFSCRTSDSCIIVHSVYLQSSWRYWLGYQHHIVCDISDHPTGEQAQWKVIQGKIWRLFWVIRARDGLKTRDWFVLGVHLLFNLHLKYLKFQIDIIFGCFDLVCNVSILLKWSHIWLQWNVFLWFDQLLDYIVQCINIIDQLYTRQLQMFQKVEYGGSPIFKVVLKC